MKKTVLGVASVLVFLSTAVVVGFIRPVAAHGTIYIRSNGSVDPPTASIQRDGAIYTFIGNIYDEIVVERDNIAVDGAGYTVQGTRAYGSTGIYLMGRSNVTIKNMKIEAFMCGIYLYMSSSNGINRNNITNNHNGIGVQDFSTYNIISGNNITANNELGIWLTYSSSNIIYHNNFIDNTQHVYIETSGCANFWDDGYPSGGNYWSNYTEEDDNGDGIGDTPYVIDKDNQDNYPLMSPWIPVEESPLLWMQWWFWAIVAAGILILAGAVYFLKKRKPITPTVPPLLSEDTL